VAESDFVFHQGDWRNHLPDESARLMIADPVYGSQDVAALAALAVGLHLPSCIFMWPLDVWNLPHKPDQLCFWVKPESTKNTSKNYSRFVEVIAMFGVEFHRQLHWSNRTGIFTDRLFRNDDHPWRKPKSLIRRLIENHWPGGGGYVYDPCAGTGTVEAVCRELGIPCVSVDLEDRRRDECP
jgi:hypothetical protein